MSGNIAKNKNPETLRVCSYLPRKVILGVISIFMFLAFPLFSYSQENQTGKPKLIVFHSSGCHKCIEVENKLMPEVEKKFSGLLEIEYLDIKEIKNYKLLLALRQKYNPEINTGLPVFYLNGYFLNGDGLARKDLKDFIAESLRAPAPVKKISAPPDLAGYFKTFKAPAVISAGLIDGINPCAFTVIIFFISFLALQGYRKRDLIVIGLSFISSVFLTYFLIGLGFFEFFYKLKSFWLISRIFNFSIGIFSIILGCFSLYDFFKFKKTGETEGFTLQLPKAIKARIHSVIGLHYRKDQGKAGEKPVIRLVLSALVTGFLVSILEAVCTGQVYLPTITFVLKTAPFKLQALAYLFVYNLAFILPLFLIFLFALAGVTSVQFAKFFRKHILIIKLLMAALFFALGAFLVLRG